MEYLQFDGASSYFEVPNSPVLSVAAAAALTAAWMRPDTLTFPATEGSGYVHWLGKGQRDAQGWTFRGASKRLGDDALDALTRLAEGDLVVDEVRDLTAVCQQDVHRQRDEISAVLQLGEGPA